MEKDKNITVGYCHTYEDKKITISLEEYKELLIIKGKYEELKSQHPSYNPTITWTHYEDDNNGTGGSGLEYPYKVTC